MAVGLPYYRSCRSPFHTLERRQKQAGGSQLSGQTVFLSHGALLPMAPKHARGYVHFRPTMGGHPGGVCCKILGLVGQKWAEYVHLHPTEELSTTSHKQKWTVKPRLMSAAKKINLGEPMVLCFLDLRTLWDEFLLSDFLETLPTSLSALQCLCDNSNASWGLT